ncbi:hypothetical protein PR048_002891 [Dryococelus australis]|uniref:DUF4371 domain-containing protein n=1 Tax=Dryococelus australis TaxID=614101 RepID=A0ABQ9ILF8_9NEOP|nr:hypothetical protein PR048_002891 [Dryococelus australis]
MKRQQQQETDFFQRKYKCIEDRDDSASDVNISDSEYEYFCSEDKDAVLITDCKSDPASTSSNNSKRDAVSIRDRESISLCTEDTGAVLLIITRSKVDSTFIVSGFYNWKKASEKFSYHGNSESHKGPEEALLAFNKKPVAAGLSAQVSKEMEEAQKALIIILLELRGNEIPDIKDWLFKQHNWLSHDIQNEILQLLSLTVVRKSNQDIKKNKYFALIVDEMTDYSTKEQVSISLRRVNDDFDVFEYSIGLYETSSTTGDTLATIIEDVLLRLDLPVEEYRCQCYDGTKKYEWPHERRPSCN